MYRLRIVSENIAEGWGLNIFQGPKLAHDLSLITSKLMWFERRGARHFVESHFVGTTFGRIRLLVDVTFRRVRHSVEKISRYDISSK